MSDGERRDRDELRPRIGGRGGEVPQERAPRFRNRLLARVARLGVAARPPSSRPLGTLSARDVPRPDPRARRCIVKARYAPMNAYGKRAAALHLSYIERDGVEQDGSAGRLYGPAEVVDVRAALDAPMEIEKRQFRFIVSPEDGAEADLTAFTRRLMAQVQADHGRVLIWGAVNHWNTDNPHVHIIVRGVDEAGRDVTIDGRYLSEGMRSRAQTILTNELGPRTEVDIQTQLAREIRQERLTSLDRTLQACQTTGGAVFENVILRRGHAAAARLLARLGRLEQLGLAARTSGGGWKMQDGWVDTLRGLGQAKDVVTRLHAAAPAADPASCVVVDDSSALAPVEGVVRAKGLHDELAGRPYAVVEGVDGRTFYVPIDVGTAEKIAEGDIVRLSVEWPQWRSGGGPGAANQTPRLRAQVQRIAPALSQQVAYRGPTWLDVVAAKAPPVPRGRLGLELADALTRRESNLRGLGVRDAKPERRMIQLNIIEAKTFGDRLAAERGFAFVESPVGLSGVLAIAPRLASGRQYAVVLDEGTKRLWVLPANKQLRLLDGRRVEGARSPDGRLSISLAGPERRPRGRER